MHRSSLPSRSDDSRAARQVLAAAGKQRDRLESDLALAQSKAKQRRSAPSVHAGAHDQLRLQSLRQKLAAKDLQMTAGTERVSALAAQNARMGVDIQAIDGLLATFRAEVTALSKSKKDAHCFERQIALLLEQMALSPHQVRRCCVAGW